MSYNTRLDIKTGEVVSFRSGTKCTVVNTFDRKLFGVIDEKIYLLLLVEKPTSEKTNASRNGFKPREDNPWKKFKIR